MSEDRRIKHTKERIYKAMLECLITTKPENITVTEICEKADINRSTFYAHYKDPIELYKKIEAEALDEIFIYMTSLENDHADYLDFLVKILTYISSHSSEYLALLKVGSSSFKKRNMDILERQEFKLSHISKEDMFYASEFYINGMFALLSKWLEDGIKETPEYMAKLIYNITAK